LGRVASKTTEAIPRKRLTGVTKKSKKVWYHLSPDPGSEPGSWVDMATWLRMWAIMAKVY